MIMFDTETGEWKDFNQVFRRPKKSSFKNAPADYYTKLMGPGADLYDGVTSAYGS